MANYPSCVNNEHVWPKGHEDRVVRSIGVVESVQCNNCLAVKITRYWLIKNAKDEWVWESKTSIS